MRLAWRNLLHDRTRLAVTVVGIAFAVFLMLFQGSLLAGFLTAASKVVDSTDADLWITARGVPCFDFPSPLPERFRALALGVEGVAEVYRVAAGFPNWQKPDGSRQSVVLVGSDAGVGEAFPRPQGRWVAGTEMPDAVLLDASDLTRLGLSAAPADVELAGRRARLLGTVTGFGSFLGSPYVFTRYEDAIRYLSLPAEQTTYLLVRVEPGHSIQEVSRALRTRLPEADVWTREEFSSRSRIFWVAQTGAGGAILTAGFLGFIIGVVIVSQTIYATTMENIEEFATLKAMGATRRFVGRVVLAQALIGGAFGYLLGVAVTLPVVALMRGAIPWVHLPWWLPLAMLAASLGMCTLASLVSIRKALTVEPAKVFRA